MSSRVSHAMELKIIVCLLWIFTRRNWRVSGYQELLDDPSTVVTEGEVDFKRLENEYAIGEVTTTSSTKVYDNATTFENITSKMIDSKVLVNPSDFKPSVHLGEIEEFRSMGGNPFNKLEPIKFENFVSVSPESESWHLMEPGKSRITFFEKNQVSTTTEISYRGSDNDKYPRPIHELTFPTEIPIPYVQNQYPPPKNPWINPIWPKFGLNSPQETYFESSYVKDLPVSVDQPSKFSPSFVDSHGPEFANLPSFDTYEQHVVPQSLENPFVKYPNFPYKFHQESLASFDGDISNDKPAISTILPAKRVPPWKKIIHLIGSILPLGLLLAALSPNVVRIGNSTQSSIPLSKYKEINLPPEHKNYRINRESDLCADLEICEMILGGSESESDMLQNVLWNFISRTPEETAMNKDLRRLFSAVKKKDCSTLSCH